MNDLALSLRQARPSDAADLARIYIDAWRDTYAGILPHTLLGNMSLTSHAARWKSMIAHAGGVLVVEDENDGAIGLCSFGAVRDRGLGMDGEIYTLYVDPDHVGRGAGRTLLRGAFAGLKERKFQSCLVWSHALNNARFFYEAMGGRRIAERTTRLGGAPVPEIGFGWKRLSVQPRRLVI